MSKYVRWLARQGRSVILRACNGRNAAIATGIVLVYYYWTDGAGFFKKASLETMVQNASLLRTVSAAYEPLKPTRLNVGNARGCAIQGRRYSMEDRMDVWMGNGVAVYAVYDGHAGEYTVDYVKKNIMSMVRERLESAMSSASGLSDPQIVEILRTSVLETDQQLIKQLIANRDLSGSTLLVAVLHGNKLVVANVGDSRGILSKNDGSTMALSIDHKPNLPKEKKRIEEAGGFVRFYGVWRVGGMLAMSRAMGDYILKQPNHITAEPDCEIFDVTNAEFFILATDGLWDVISNVEAAQIVRSKIKTESETYAADALTVEAYKRGSMDNISVMVVKLDQSNNRLNSQL